MNVSPTAPGSATASVPVNGATPPASSSSSWIVGDPDAGTRISGTRDWVLAPGARLQGGLATVGAAELAAARISRADAQRAVAILRDGASFAIHEVTLGRDSFTWRAPVLDPFRLDDATLKLLGRGGYLGDQPVPSTQLVGLVDSVRSAHLATTGPFRSWGFVPGLPVS